MVYFIVKIVIAHPLVVAHEVHKIICCLSTAFVGLAINILTAFEVNHYNV